MSGCDTAPLSLINASNLTGGRPKIFNSNTRAGYSKVGNQKLENKAIECLNVAEALHEMEAKYYSMFENAVSGIFQTTQDGRYISANPALARIYGYNSAAELMGCLTDIRDQPYLITVLHS